MGIERPKTEGVKLLIGFARLAQFGRGRGGCGLRGPLALDFCGNLFCNSLHVVNMMCLGANVKGNSELSSLAIEYTGDI